MTASKNVHVTHFTLKSPVILSPYYMLGVILFNIYIFLN